MDMYVFHYQAFALQLLVGLAVALVVLELYRLGGPRPRRRHRRSH